MPYVFNAPASKPVRVYETGHSLQVITLFFFLEMRSKGGYDLNESYIDYQRNV